MLGAILSKINWGSSVINTSNYGKVIAQRGLSYYIAPGSGGGTYENNFYLKESGATVGISSAIEKTEQELKSQMFVNELNTYVSTYNEEHQNDEDFISLKIWKYNDGDYPSFE